MSDGQFESAIRHMTTPFDGLGQIENLILDTIQINNPSATGLGVLNAAAVAAGMEHDERGVSEPMEEVLEQLVADGRVIVISHCVYALPEKTA